MAKAVFCIATSENQAERIIRELKAAGFPQEDVSVLFPDTAGTNHFAHEHHTKAPEGATTGAGAGGLVGGALGWLTGIGALAIPGAGLFIAAGPIMAALSGAAVGAAVGGVAGALVGMGIPEFEARRYQGRISNGNILISIHVADPGRVSEARHIVERQGAEDIATASERTVPKSRSGIKQD